MVLAVRYGAVCTRVNSTYSIRLSYIQMFTLTPQLFIIMELLQMAVGSIKQQRILTGASRVRVLRHVPVGPAAAGRRARWRRAVVGCNAQYHDANTHFDGLVFKSHN